MNNLFDDLLGVSKDKEDKLKDLSYSLIKKPVLTATDDDFILTMEMPYGGKFRCLQNRQAMLSSEKDLDCDGTFYEVRFEVLRPGQQDWIALTPEHVKANSAKREEIIGAKLLRTRLELVTDLITLANNGKDPIPAPEEEEDDEVRGGGKVGAGVNGHSAL